MNGQEGLQTEIQALEQKLAQKKQEVLDSNEPISEKQMLKQVIKEHTNELQSAPVSSQGTSQPTTQNRNITGEEEQKINTLIEHALKNGLKSAINEAKKTGDAFFIDLLHDRLADEYYQKLISARKIKPN